MQSNTTLKRGSFVRLPDHQYKVLVEGNNEPMYFMSIASATRFRATMKDIHNKKVWIMIKQSDGSYLPLD